MKRGGGIIIKRVVFISFIFFTFLFSSINVYASANVKARIGNKYFDTLKEAIAAATSTDTITLTGNVTLSETMEINKTVNIDLNNHTLTGEEKVFLVQGGSLNLSGTGTIMETKPNYGAVMLIGSDDSTKKDFSTVSVGSGITLQGWSGIFIDHTNKTGYGILVNMNGTINAVDDVNGGTGIGIYVNGNIQHINNSPVVNLSNTAKITSTGNGIYAAGYATYNINGAYISGGESGLGIKSGAFNILDGTILGTGEDKTPTGGNNNGINASGTAIQIESNPGYAGNIELNIKNGTFTSNDSYVIYEYTTNNNTSTEVTGINLSGGTYTSKAKKDALSFSDSFKKIHTDFISGGTYSSDPTEYLKSGYSVFLDGAKMYQVTSGTMAVFNLSGENGGNIFSSILTVSIILIIGVIVYLNRQRILDLIK